MLLEPQYGLLYALRLGCLDEGKGTHIGQTHGDHLQQHGVQWHAINLWRGISLKGIELFLRVEAKANLVERRKLESIKVVFPLEMGGGGEGVVYSHLVPCVRHDLCAALTMTWTPRTPLGAAPCSWHRSSFPSPCPSQ